MRVWLTLIVVLFLAIGCSVNRIPVFVSDQQSSFELFQNDLFPAVNEVVLESEKDIFELPSDAKDFIDNYILQFRDPDIQVEKLTQALFSRQQMGVTYLNEANTVAKQTYFNAKANCLSLTILAYAMSDYARFDVKFQEINIPENWVRRAERNLQNGHINLKIRPRSSEVAIVDFTNNYTEVDFNRPQKRYTKKNISKQRVIAMFYNNNGADYLLSKHYTAAFAYFRAALNNDPNFVPALINLGALYRLYGKYELAEQIYTKAIHLDPDNFNSLENLAILQEYTGNFARAREIKKVIAARRQSNPYYHLIIGEEAYERGDYEKALISLHTASRLDQHIHEIYFLLAKTYYKLGDMDMSEQNFKLAKRSSISDSQRSIYQGKLELLSRNNQ